MALPRHKKKVAAAQPPALGKRGKQLKSCTNTDKTAGDSVVSSQKKPRDSICHSLDISKIQKTLNSLASIPIGRSQVQEAGRKEEGGGRKEGSSRKQEAEAVPSSGSTGGRPLSSGQSSLPASSKESEKSDVRPHTSASYLTKTNNNNYGSLASRISDVLDGCKNRMLFSALAEAQNDEEKEDHFQGQSLPEAGYSGGVAWKYGGGNHTTAAGEDSQRQAASSPEGFFKRPSDSVDLDECTQAKRMRRSVSFGGVTAFYFRRTQGFLCVPSQGGATLGMAMKHEFIRKYSMEDHEAEQLRRSYYRLKHESNTKTLAEDNAELKDVDKCFPVPLNVEIDATNRFYIREISASNRRALLKDSGVSKIDSFETAQCRAIRESRRICGCSCKGSCLRDTCPCAQEGVRCQVDSEGFPCGCTEDGCANPHGRRIYISKEIRNHMIRTLQRMELERRQTEHVTGSIRSNGNGILAPLQTHLFTQNAVEARQNGVSGTGAFHDSDEFDNGENTKPT